MTPFWDWLGDPRTLAVLVIAGVMWLCLVSILRTGKIDVGLDWTDEG